MKGKGKKRKEGTRKKERNVMKMNRDGGQEAVTIQKRR
jgi:hypothetical protein